MATRADVYVSLPNGRVASMYNHWDGYLSSLGAELVECDPTPYYSDLILECDWIERMDYWESLWKVPLYCFERIYEHGIDLGICRDFDYIQYDDEIPLRPEHSCAYWHNGKRWLVWDGDGSVWVPLAWAVKRGWVGEEDYHWQTQGLFITNSNIFE